MKAEVKIYAKTIEQEAIDQINTLVETGVFDDCDIRIMPDCHSGAGCVIGFTSGYKDKIISNIQGVDICCGMLLSELSKKPDTKQLQETIEKNVPAGREIHESTYFGGNVPKVFKERYKYIKEKILELRCYRYLKEAKRLPLAIGSLGGGEERMIASGIYKKYPL